MIANAGAGLEAGPVDAAGVVEASELFERLALVIVSGDVAGVRGQHVPVFRHGAFKVARVRILHGERVAGKVIQRVLRDQVAECVQAVLSHVLLYPRMPCPYFYPLARFPFEERSSVPLLPLGAAYRGECRAVPAAALPEDAALRQFCNLGYAGGRCANFPPGDGPDAVRFAISGHGGGRVSVSYAIERAHLPFENGVLEFLVDADRFSSGHADARLERQARVYLESYLSGVWVAR
jgi:hypothetical protein